MCEFCEKGKEIISEIAQYKDGIIQTCAGITEGNNLTTSSIFQFATNDGMGIFPPKRFSGKINYCPMCGRKLTEDKE